jgi:hypothetical protein
MLLTICAILGLAVLRISAKISGAVRVTPRAVMRSLLVKFCSSQRRKLRRRSSALSP